MIQFIEQAFEWEKLTYVPYPYFWADRKTQWTDLADLQSADPIFADFLRAGSVRTVLSVRPGFEPAVQLFLKFGIVWSGGNAPAPGDPDYVSIADEIRIIQRAPDIGDEIEHWDTKLPTSLIWLSGSEPLPSNTQNNSGSPGGSSGSSGSPSKPKNWLCRLLSSICE